MGLIPRRLPFTTSNTVVRTFRHAVALDERRAKLKANLWNKPLPHEENLGLSKSPKVDASKVQHKKTTGDSDQSEKHSSFIRISEEEHELTQLERQYSELQGKPTDIEEVWFAVRLLSLPLQNSNLITPPCRVAIAVRIFQRVEDSNLFAIVYRCRWWFRFEQN